MALEQPTLLAIDDLHWADTPSLRWLLYLTRRLDGVPLLVVAGTRPPEGEGRDPRLVAELIADPEAAAIRPGPLGRASIAVLARELHGIEPDEAFCAAVETATGGNPLFVGAVLDAIARDGTSPTADHAAQLLEAGAQGVSRVVAVRLARLEPEALDLLRASSVLGDGIELRHAAALAGVEAGALGSRCLCARSARPAPARGSAGVLPSGRPSRRLRDARCGRKRRRASPGRRAVIEAGAPLENAAGHCSGRTAGRLVRGLDTPPSGGALTRSGRSRCRRRISHPRARGRDRSSGAGSGARRDRPCREVDERPGRGRPPPGCSRSPPRHDARLQSRSRAGPRAVVHRPDRGALAVFQQALDKVDRKRIQISTSCSGRS